MKSPIALLESLYHDVNRLSLGVKGTDRDIITIRKRFKHEGYGFLTVALPALCSALERGLEEGRFACPEGFARIPRGSIPRLFSGMFREVFDAESGLLKESPSVEMVKNLRQILRIFKKVQPEGTRLEETENHTRADFARVDASLQGITFPDRETHLLKRVASLCLNGLKRYEPDKLRLRHGPGAVYDGETPNQKWSSVVDAITQDRIDIEMFGLSEFAYQLNPTLLLRSDSLADSPPEHRLHHYRGTSGESARLVTVPKTFTSLRTITVEPCVRQFLQQGLNSLLRDSIKECGILSNSLALTDQTRNQVLALEGSRTGKWATLDLKSASDLLSISLVKLVFDSHRDFLDALISCRSNEVEDGNCRIWLRKYAGMGNATTFPVQSVTFAIIALAAICDKLGYKPTYRRLVALSSKVRVFGDDIIVDKDFVHHVIAWLEVFGLRVNTAKSFFKGNFRESCGVDAYMGVDVTPIYLKARPDGSSTEASSIADLVSTANQAWFAGLYKTASLLQLEVESRLGRRLPLVRRDSEGLGWHTRTDAVEITSISQHLHRPEVYTAVIKPRKRSDILDGMPALLKYFLTSYESMTKEFDPLSMFFPKNVDKDHLKRSPVRFRNRIVWKKVAA